MGKDSPLLPAKPQNIQGNRPGFSGTLRLAGWDPLIFTETRAKEPVSLESSGPPRRLARCPELPWASLSRGTGTASPSPATPRLSSLLPGAGAAQPPVQGQRLGGVRARPPTGLQSGAVRSHRLEEPHPDAPAQAGFLTGRRLWAREMPLSSLDSI